MYRVTESLRVANGNLKRHSEIAKNDNLLLENFKLDFLYSDEGNVTYKKGERFDAIMFTSRHSLYGISRPYIEYHVSKNKKLWRVESSIDHNLTIEDEHFMYVKFDAIARDVERFKVYEANGSKLVYIQSAGKEPLFFELAHPSAI